MPFAIQLIAKLEQGVNLVKPRYDQAANPSSNLKIRPSNPVITLTKVGDLVGIRVHKFRMVNQLTLLAYRVVDDESVKLLTVGSHENFYRDLRRVDN